jgi:hypothetical protein
MKRAFWGMLFIGILILAFMGRPSNGIAEVNIDIGVNIGVPPPVVIPAPPPVVVIPSTYVYFVPDIEVEILFYQGCWYRPHQGRWYRATAYNGPWVYVELGRVPPALLGLPPDYRRVPPGHQRIPHGQLQKDWRRWKNEKHWYKHDAKREYSAGKSARGGKGKGKHRGD